MSNLVTLADFPAYVPFSANIGAHLVDPHIREAQTFDVWPLLPGALQTALAAAKADWLPAELALFDDFVKPLLVTEAARRMLLWHGLHITPNGAETVSDVGHMPISNVQRTELRADLQAKANHYRARLEAALRLAYPSPGTTCGVVRRRRGHGGMTSAAL